MKKLLLLSLATALLTFSANAIPVDGYCYLANQTDHSGTTIIFYDYEQGIAVDTAYTDSSGYYQAEVEPYVYDILYSHSRYFDLMVNTPIWHPTMLDTVILQPWPGIPINGQVSGILSNDTSYIVTDSIWIAEGEALVIEAGVEIYFAEEAHLGVFGRLRALGTLTDSIVFKQFMPGYYWAGIRLYDGSDDSSRLEFCEITGSYNGFGGGLYLDNVDPTIANCYIHHNTAFLQGGGIFCELSNSLISDCLIDSNQAFYEGGGICLIGSNPTISNCRISHSDGSSGGGVFCEFSNPTLIECEIDSNNGHGIYLLSSQPIISGSWIRYNSGGGIYCADNSAPVFTDCEISGNESTYLGGGIYCLYSSPSFVNCLISDNFTTYYDGGGGYIYYSPNTVFSHCQFVSNRAYYGGGLELVHSGLTISACSFSDNSATAWGGGILFLDSDAIVDSCDFSNNQAQNGGGVYAFTFADLSILNSTFTENSALQNGGGIYYVSNTIQNVSHCEFRGNSAGIDGGGLVAQANSQVTLSHCLFADNDAQNSGGGIYLNDADPTFTNCTISNNSAGSYGGGACLAYCADIEVENSIIAYNAQYGFYFQNAFLFETNIEYCDFFNNSVADYCFYPAGAAPVGLGVLDTLNANGDSCDVYGNIFLNPQFLDTINGNYHLLANSPCIDAGNPTSPWDPDSTITDIGAFYFDQTQAVEDYSFSLLPLAFSLECFPNPFNSSLALRFELSDASQAELKIYDISGREIETLDIGHWTLGKNEVVWNAEGMPSGIYFIRLAVIGARSSEVEVRKVVLLK